MDTPPNHRRAKRFLRGLIGAACCWIAAQGGMFATLQVVQLAFGGALVAPGSANISMELTVAVGGLLVIGFVIGPIVLGAWAWGTRARPWIPAVVGIVLGAVFATPMLAVGAPGAWRTTLLGSQVGWVLASAVAAAGAAFFRHRSQLANQNAM